MSDEHINRKSNKAMEEMPEVSIPLGIKWYDLCVSRQDFFAWVMYATIEYEKGGE